MLVLRTARRKLPATIEVVSLAAFRIFMRLAEETAVLFADGALTAALTDRDPAADTRLDEAIARRLEASDPFAAGELVEAQEWLRAILVGLAEQLRTYTALVHHSPEAIPELSDDEVRAELRGPGGSFLRGMLLTVAATETLLSDERLPRALPHWCDLALREVQAAANSFRAAGLSIPMFVTSRTEFDEGTQVRGSLSYIATREGIRIRGARGPSHRGVPPRRVG